MELYIQKTQQKKKMSYSGSVGSLLKKLKINPETVLVTRNDTLATDDEDLDDSDRVEILEVVSGG